MEEGLGQHPEQKVLNTTKTVLFLVIFMAIGFLALELAHFLSLFY